MSRRRRLLIIGAAACALLVVAGAGVAWWIVHEPVGDVHAGATLPFTASDPTLPSTDQPAEPRKDRFGPAWPLYGRVDSRTRNATDLNAVKPPYRVAWKVNQHALIEFPPSYNRGVLYLGRDDGWLVASNVFTGKVLWKRRFGSIPDQPAIWEGKLYFGTFDQPGSVYAVDAKTGHVIWRRQLTDQVESSMVVVDGRVFTGCNDGTVRALNALTGKVMWQFHAAGAVKDSLAVDGGRVFFGAYGGHDVQPPGERRQGAVGHAHQRPVGRIPLGQLLLLAGGRLRPCLHRQHRRQGLLVRRQHRAGGVDVDVPRLGVRLAGRRFRRRVLDQLRRHRRRDERAHRGAPVDAQAALPVAVLGDHHREPGVRRRHGREGPAGQHVRARSAAPAPSAGTSTTASTTARSSPPAG